MSQRIFRVLVLLCLLAVLACGSPRIYPRDRQTRDRRHASCTSCRRERPEALASWYAPPARREYPGLEPETRRWPSNQPFQPNPSFYPSPYSPYEGAPGSRGGPGIASPAGTCKRENPFSFQRDLDFDVAPAPSAPVHGVGAPVTPYQPRLLGARSLGRTPYQRPSFYDVIKRESDVSPSNGYPDYDPSEDQPSFEGVRGPSRPYEDPKKKVSVVYRADKYSDDSLEQGNSNAQPEEYFRRQAPEHYSRRQAPEHYSRRQAPEQYPRMQAPDGRSPADGVERFQQPRREQFRVSPVVRAPEIKYNPYNLSPELNVLKMMQTVDREGLTIANGSVWRDQKGQELEGSPLEAVERDDQQRARDVSVLNDDGQPGDGVESLEDGTQEFQGNRDVVEGHGNVERSKKSTMANPSTETSVLEPGKMWKKEEPEFLEISTEPLVLP